MKKVTTSDWKAWVNKMPGPGTPHHNTLHVVGTVDTYSKDLAYLQKREPQGINPHILLLDLHVITGFVPVDNPQRVHYYENLAEEQSYKSIEIYYEGKREATIDEIPIAL